MRILSVLPVRVIILLPAIASVLPGAAQQSPTAKPAVPREPIAAILDAFRTHQVVALGEGTEGNIQGHAFRLSLIRDPKFAARVNDIVVECERFYNSHDRIRR